jgi:hypothetical protein
MVGVIAVMIKFMLFLLAWMFIGGWMVYKWVRTAEGHNGGYDKTEHIQTFLIIVAWVMLGAELFIVKDYFGFDKWLLVFGSLIASQIPGAIGSIKGFKP